MGETLNEQCRVSDDGLMDCKTLLFGKKGKKRKCFLFDGTIQESSG